MADEDRSSTTGDHDDEGPDGGPAMTQGGAMPTGSQTGWKTSQPNPDATRPETMPHTVSAPMPGETGHEDREHAASTDDDTAAG